MKIYPPNAIRVLWTLFWFWNSMHYSLPLLFPKILYWVSAINVLIYVIFGGLFICFWFLRSVNGPSLFIKLVFLYLTWVGFATLISPYSWEHFLTIWAYFVATLFSILTVFLGSQFIKVDFAFLLAGRAYVLGAVFTTLVFFSLGLQNSNRLGNDILLHPNAIGFLYGSVLSFLLFFRLYKIELLRIIMIIVFSLLLGLTFSKTSILAVICASISTILLKKGWRRIQSIAIFGGIIVTITVALKDYWWQQIQYYLANPQWITTITGRVVLWKWVLDMVQLRPFLGYGYRTFKHVFLPYSMSLGFTRPATQAHNAYLDVLFVGGYIGLLIFITILFVGLLEVRGFVSKLKNSRISFFTVFMITFVLVRSLVEGALNMGHDFFMLVTAILLVEASMLKCDRKTLQHLLQ